MIHSKTVLILGAGASNPYGFPIGPKLIESICSHPTEYTIRNPGYMDDGIPSVLHKSFQKNRISTFRSELTKFGLPSIDDFLSIHPEYSEIGKASIAAALIPYESQMVLDQKVECDWYRYLRKLMGVDYQDFKQSAEKLSIITFNYDRSFEYFFFDFLTASYGRDRAVDLFGIMEIIHVYGQLGKPDFLAKDGRAFSPKLDMRAIEKCVAEIKVIPENVDDSEEFTQSRLVLHQAEVICFLGFGYLRKNVQRLRIDELLGNIRLLGTAFQLGVRERNEAQSLFHSQIHLGSFEEKALDFLKNNDVFGPIEASTFSISSR